MASYSTNEFKGGLKIMLDGDPHTIVENEFVKPGKGQAFNRARVKNLITGRTVERTFKSGDSVEAADVLDTEMQYLYNDGEHWHFMDQKSYEQIAAEKTAMGESHLYLKLLKPILAFAVTPPPVVTNLRIWKLALLSKCRCS